MNNDMSSGWTSIQRSDKLLLEQGEWAVVKTTDGVTIDHTVDAEDHWDDTRKIHTFETFVRKNKRICTSCEQLVPPSILFTGRLLGLKNKNHWDLDELD